MVIKVGVSHLQVLCLSDLHCPCWVSSVTQLNIREVQYFYFTAPNIQKKHDHFTSDKMVLWAHFLFTVPAWQRKGRNLCLSGFTWGIALPRSLPHCLSPALHKTSLSFLVSFQAWWPLLRISLFFLCTCPFNFRPFRGYWSRWENPLRLGVTLQELTLSRSGLKLYVGCSSVTGSSQRDQEMTRKHKRFGIRRSCTNYVHAKQVY